MVESLPLPEIDRENADKLRLLTQRTIRAAQLGLDCSALQHDLDTQVLELYGLNRQEIER